MTQHHVMAPHHPGRRFLPVDGRSSLVSRGCGTVPQARSKLRQMPRQHVGPRFSRPTCRFDARAHGSISRKERGHAARARGPRASTSPLPRWAALPLVRGAATETVVGPGGVKRVLAVKAAAGVTCEKSCWL
jgi:hypothetical protein